MSDPVALVCVRTADPNDASERRWRRRAQPPYSVRAGAIVSVPAPPSRRGGGLRGGLLLLLLAGTAWAGVSVARLHSGDSVFSRRIGAGCEELEPCLSLEAEAERRADGCSLFCGRASAELAAARQMRFRAEERRAVRDHYRERERVADLERQRQSAERRDEWQRERTARAQEADRERQHQLELERLRQEHLDRRLAEERQRRVGYFTTLGAPGRALRLKRCLEKSHERCDALTLDLLDAARDDDERRTLAETNEGVVHAVRKRATAADEAEAAASAEISAEASAAPREAADTTAAAEVAPALQPAAEPGVSHDVRTIPSS
ncbi:MAG TPA: hypothetical protein VMG12_23905 [Polyangiaceae bacterium]|nr:hypothetical protein [Polyangiaceae bacterium]